MFKRKMSSRVWNPGQSKEDYNPIELDPTFVVISNKGYWGKAKTLREAAKYAHVSSLKDLSECAIYLSNTDKITVDYSGGVVWEETVTVVKIQ